MKIEKFVLNLENSKKVLVTKKQNGNKIVLSFNAGEGIKLSADWFYSLGVIAGLYSEDSVKVCYIPDEYKLKFLIASKEALRELLFDFELNDCFNYELKKKLFPRD
jgi:hypothetical protein